MRINLKLMLILKGRSRGLKKPGFFLNISVGGKSGSFMGDKLKELRAITPRQQWH